MDKLFCWDGSSSHSSRKVNNPMCKLGAKKFNIAGQGPDMNPIENVFKDTPKVFNDFKNKQQKYMK